jgi:hypothetical protein
MRPGVLSPFSKQLSNKSVKTIGLNVRQLIGVINAPMYLHASLRSAAFDGGVGRMKEGDQVPE